jgi:hypothetical protein
MKKAFQFQYLLWILLSVGLFVFVIPISSDVLTKIVAGYVFYLFIKQVLEIRVKEADTANRRLNVLNKRMDSTPHKTKVYIHDKEKEKEKKKEPDVSFYVMEERER